MTKITKPRTYSSVDMYKLYKKNHTDSNVPYWMFKEVLSRFNRKSSDAVIFGSLLNLGPKLGYLMIKKINRNYKKAIPDWGESKRIKQEIIDRGGIPKDKEHPEGEDWIKFYTDSWYLRWAWVKKYVCRIKNQSVYRFTPTANRSKKSGDNSLGKLGNRGKLTLANRINPTLHTVYEQNSEIG